MPGLCQAGCHLRQTTEFLRCTCIHVSLSAADGQELDAQEMLSENGRVAEAEAEDVYATKEMETTLT